MTQRNRGGKPRVAILTTLVDFSSAYSLVGVILDQTRALHRARYPYDLLCLKNFKESDKALAAGLNVRYELPQTLLHDYQPGQGPIQSGGGKEGFDEQVRIHLDGRPDRGERGYLEILEPYDVVITHDIMFLEWFLPMNQAVRACIDRWPEKNWLHWVHSAPSGQPGGTVHPSTLRYSAAPESTYVFLNSTQLHDLALMLGTTRENIAVVQNSRDVRDLFAFSRETELLIDTYRLFEHDVLQVYPFSTPRWIAKGVKQLLRLASEWKKVGSHARLVLVNAHGNSKKDEPTIAALEEYVRDSGLKLDEDVILTSRFARLAERSARTQEERASWREWLCSVPHRVVRELNLMSNLFVFPSDTECCSLIQAEASVLGNKLVVLNRDFPPMREFDPGNRCLHYEFKRNNPDDRQSPYYMCVAREILAEMAHETAVMHGTIARNEVYNRDWIFENQFEPLLWKRSVGKRFDVVVGTAGRGSESVVEAPTVPPPDSSEGTLSLAPLVNYEDPQPGDACPIYEECSVTQRDECYAQAGKCLMLGEEL